MKSDLGRRSNWIYFRDYAAPYSRILKSKGFHHGYIDAFSGPASTSERPAVKRSWEVPWSPWEFSHHLKNTILSDLDGEKVDFLRSKVGKRPDVKF
jgi:hypothetical protein